MSAAPAIAVDRNFATVLAETYDAPAVEPTKALLAEAALKLVYDQTAVSPCQGKPQNLKVFRSRSVSQDAHPFVAKNPTKGMEMSSASVVRKLPSTNDQITKAYTAERVSFALQAWGRERASPIKCIRRFTGVDRKTAEAWWHGRNPPQTDHLLNLARNIPELKSEVRRLLELEQDQAEAFQREAIALLQRYAR